MSESDDEIPALPSDTLAALQSFYSEQAEQQKKLQNAFNTGNLQDVSLQEDWQLSQFWYTQETAKRLADEALSVAGPQGRIACISAPTAYQKIKELKPESCTVRCLEFDNRFAIYGEDFQFYDYKDPINLPLEWKHTFDIVIVDPPFLSEECLCKTAVTAKYLTKDKVILCTGAVMEELALKLLDARPCAFIPQHTNQLQNEFRCFTNYTSKLFNET